MVVDIKNTILVVDDKSINRFMLAEMFRDSFNIIEASGGKEAIEMIEAYGDSLGLILLDIIMPDIDGFGVLDYLKENDMLKRVPVILVTDDSSEDTGNRAYEYDVADMVIKPFEPRLIKRRAQNIMELYAYRNMKGE